VYLLEANQSYSIPGAYLWSKTVAVMNILTTIAVIKENDDYIHHPTRLIGISGSILPMLTDQTPLLIVLLLPQL